MTRAQQTLKRELKILRAIKTYPKRNGYYVVTYSELGAKTEMLGSTVRSAIKRLERQGVVEVKKDIALFGGVYKRGIKILITI